MVHLTKRLEIATVYNGNHFLLFVCLSRDELPLHLLHLPPSSHTDNRTTPYVSASMLRHMSSFTSSLSLPLGPSPRGRQDAQSAYDASIQNLYSLRASRHHTQSARYVAYLPSIRQILLFVISNPLTSIALISFCLRTHLAVIYVLLPFCITYSKRRLQGLWALIYILVVKDLQLFIHHSET